MNHLVWSALILALLLGSVVANDYSTCQPVEALVVPPLTSQGDFDVLKWKHDGTLVDFAVLSLDPLLSTTMEAFCNQVGLAHLFQGIHVGNSSTQDEIVTLPNGQQWSVGKDQDEEDLYESDMYWVEVANEATFEEVVSLLTRAGMDSVLDTLANVIHPDSWTLFGGGLGFLVINHVGDINQDMYEQPEGVVTLQVPLFLPTNETMHIRIRNEDREGLVPYEPNMAMVIPQTTTHVIGECDFRQTGHAVVIATIWLADIHDDNVDELANADESIFPLKGDVDYLWSQQGRFWGNGASFTNDGGRKRFFVVEDELHDCPSLIGQCNDLVTRRSCPRTCNVYLDNDVYYEFLQSETRNSSSTTNDGRERPSVLQRAFQELRMVYERDHDWMEEATDDIDWINAYGIILLLVILIASKRGATHQSNQYRNNALYLGAVLLRYCFRFEYLISPSLSTSILQSYEIFTVVHPVTSRAIVLTHFATYWTMIAAWRAKTLRGMLVCLLLFECPVVYLNAYVHYYDENETIYRIRDEFLFETWKFAVDDIIRGYILCPLLTYGYLLPKVSMHWAHAALSSISSTQEL